MKISLILTCFREAENIGGLISDILSQSKLPDEMVVVDAGSPDETVSVLKSFETKFAERGTKLSIHVALGASIAHGRNVAIGLASHEVIAVTDAGCRVDRNWLERITDPIFQGRADFVGGFFLPVTRNHFQSILATLTTAKNPGPSFMPSSRSVAFCRRVWQGAGGYPEWLPWGEDTYFNQRCLANGARYVVVDDAIVHWEVRRTWHQAVVQFRRYAFGDGLARRFSYSLALAPIVYTLVIAGLVFGHSMALALVPLLGASWVFRKRGIKAKDGLYAICLATSIQAARAYGYLGGLISSVGLKDVRK
mgnify:CR=1 FL=1